MTSPGTALVRRPSPLLAHGIVTYAERRPVDVELAREQWAAYVDALREAGWRIAEVEPADDSPDSVFVEDVVVAYDGVAVIARPGATERRVEVAGAEHALATLGLATHRIEPPGTLDGGDVLRAGDTVYVGTGGRTNDDGARRLEAILAPLGARVVPVPIGGVLHLKSAVTALPDASLVAYAPLAPSIAEQTLNVPEPSGSQVVALGERRVLLAADCPRTAEALAARGFDPVVVEIGEFQKLEGCVTCLSVLLPGVSN